LYIVQVKLIFRKPSIWLSLTFVITLAFIFPAVAQSGEATVHEFRKTLTTYPFSDPDPVPRMGPLYPYFRFDGYTDKSIQKEWTVVELENEYIRVMILPEVGGKIWTAIEKSSGKPFLYYNHVVKFRDISQRGPWTSGGIEPNYGIIGHTANCATPIDYVTRTNPDGSVSCIVGALDLVTRTRWALDIRLHPGEAFFTTRSFWFNHSGEEQPYYTWMNAAIPAREDLELIYPGNAYLGHGGEPSSWSLHPGNGKNLAFYKQNDFGSYKSYHVFGEHTEFFGAYYHTDDLGLARYSLRDDKAGKKIWIWGLSQQGMIWDKLLTDTDGQYVEVQSGRLFNQSAESSMYTPFGHRGFAPFQTDTWTEYWMPVRNTEGMDIANPTGVLNVVRHPERTVVMLSPVVTIRDTLRIYAGSRLVSQELVEARPLAVHRREVNVKSAEKVRVLLGANRIVYDDGADMTLSRPVEPVRGFDWNSVQGLHLQGRSLIHQKNYSKALASLEACLDKDPNYLPALADQALLHHKLMRYSEALTSATRALRIDTYHPQANYYYGLTSLALGKDTDAKDGFEIAAQSNECRSAAFAQLARLHFREKNYGLAKQYAERSLESNSANVMSLQVSALAHKRDHQNELYEATLNRIQSHDALDPFVGYERYTTGELSGEEFVKGLRGEMPHEVLLELAIFYQSLGLTSDAARILSLAPARPEVLYWKAWLNAELGKDFADDLRNAGKADHSFTFPFRPESMQVFTWAWSQSQHWTAAYYKGLLFDHLLQPDSAKFWIDKAGSPEGFAPFYVFRAGLSDPGESAEAETDLKKAASLQPGNWRYGKELIQHYIRNKEYTKAYEVSKNYFTSLPGDFRLGLLFAKAAVLKGDYAAAAGILDKLSVLPYEGAQESRQFYREAHLMLALDQMKAKKWKNAISEISLARQWPERLGAGKPYPEDIDERVEDWLEYVCRRAMKDPGAGRSLEKVSSFREPGLTYSSLTVALAHKSSGNDAMFQSVVSKFAVADPELASWLTSAAAGSPPVLSDSELKPADYKVLQRWLTMDK
jgi:tetratricopeptide (TPR) repeat protein